MQSSSIFHVHSVWVNTFILVEHLTLLTAVPERVRTNCKLMWVINVPLTSVSSEEKINLFPPQSKVWYGSFLIAFLSCASLLGKSVEQIEVK